VLEAGFWGFVGGFALVIGALIGLYLPPSQRVIGLVMGFGAGVLVSALSFDLTREAFDRGGGDTVAFGLVAGGLAFFVGDLIIDRRGGEHRKRSSGAQAGGSALAIVLGALLDGLPESAAIGIDLVEGSGVGAAFVGAVFLSNLPESISAATGLRKAGRPASYVLGLWIAVLCLSTVAAAVGYGAFGGASDEAVGLMQAFAAGAILTMLADTMMPEAFEYGGPLVGLVTVLGFATAFLLWTIENT
jgi:ZIP family zinc transporter